VADKSFHRASRVCSPEFAYPVAAVNTATRASIVAIAPSPEAALDYSVVAPLYNEAGNVDLLLTELREALSNVAGSYEVVLVDDGSRDETRAAVLRAIRNWPECRLVAFRRNQGQAAALLTGMRQARGAVIVTLDGDGQNVPADIPRVLAALGDADLVVGARQARQDSRVRLAMSRVANAVRSRFLGDAVHDAGCGLKAMRREVVDAFIPIRTLYSFMPALAVAAGYRVVECPVQHRARRAGVANYGLRAFAWRPLVDMIGVWWFTRRRFAGRID
jgi:glycosyltransferase involved in cell wall biosynthesis